MKKHLLFVCHNAQFNGAEYSLFRLLKELHLNWKVSVLAPPGGEFEKRLKELEITFYPFFPEFPFRLKHDERSALSRFIPKLVENTKELILTIPKPDLIHSNTFFVWEGVALAQHFNCPHVWNLREIVSASPAWVTAFGLDYQFDLMNQLSDQFICVSKALHHSLPDQMKSKSLAVHNGIDPKKVLSRGEARTWMEDHFNFDTQTKILLTVGNFIPEKGHRFLIPIAKKLLSKYQKIKFLWVGRHDYHFKTIQEEIKLAGLETSFICPGQIEQFGKYMAGADLYLLASETEAFPTVLLEARAAGVPFIARDCGGAVEIADEGGGLCTALDDSSSFCDEIIKTIEHPSRFSNFNEKAFTMTTMKEGYEQVYLKLIESNPQISKQQEREKILKQVFSLEADLKYSRAIEKKLEKLLTLRGLHRLIKWLLKR